MAKWTKLDEKQLRRHWNEGLTAAQIVKELDGIFTRNAVIGKAHRMGLEKRQSPIGRPMLKGVPAEPVKPKKHHLTIAAEERDDKRKQINKTAYGTPKKLADIGSNECRWPIGENADMLFCCAPTDGGSYCKKHNSINHKNTRKINQ